MTINEYSFGGSNGLCLMITEDFMNEIFLSSSHMVFYITLAQSEWKNIIVKARNKGMRAVLILNSLDMRTNTKHLSITL